MIYLVTKTRELFNNQSYKIIGVEESLRLLNPLKIVGVDTETKGINCHTGQLLSLQLGCKDFQVVIDCTTVDITAYKEFLESDRLFLFWNARFDLKWLFNYKIVPRNVYDGFLAEKLLWLGYPIVLTPEVWDRTKCDRYDFIAGTNDGGRKKESYYILYMNLKKAGEYYLGVELDKSIRGQIIWRGLTEEVIIYAALDVAYLEEIREKQLEALRAKGLLTAIDYENRFIIPLAYMEYCGVKVDIDKWKAKMAKDKAAYDKAIEAMNAWLIENEPDSPYITIDRQGRLFEDISFDLTPKVSLNWNSTKQVMPIFRKHGVEVTVVRKGDDKDSIDEKVLAPQKDKCSLIPLYLDYKGWAKVVSTYGENFLDQINKETGRLYTNFNPIGTDTAKTCSNICLILILFVTLFIQIFIKIPHIFLEGNMKNSGHL